MITEYIHTTIKKWEFYIVFKKNSKRKAAHATTDLGGRRNTKAEMGMRTLRETEIANDWQGEHKQHGKTLFLS